MDPRPKIEVVRVSSIERGSFRPLDGVQLRAAYSHVRVGTYCPEPEPEPEPDPEPKLTTLPETKAPVEHPRKFKKNLGPVSRLLRRRHQATCLATKSCDNIYSVNRNSNSLDWRFGQSVTEQGLPPARESNSLDWRVGRSVTSGSNGLDWKIGETRSAEQLSRSTPVTSEHLQTPSTKSKIASFLRKLSPRLSRPTSKASLQSSPTTVGPWVQVEYSAAAESNEAARPPPPSSSSSMGSQQQQHHHHHHQEIDPSFQRELRSNELKKRMAGATTASQITVKVIEDKEKIQRPKIQIQDVDSNAFVM